MSSNDIVMLIEKPHVRVKLYPRRLEVDLTEGARKELEDMVESREVLRHTLGFLFQTLIPLDVPVKDIESTKIDERGQVKIVVPHRRDLTIRLSPEESKTLLAGLDKAVADERARITKEERVQHREFQAHQPGRKHFDEDNLKSSDME